MTGLIGGLAVPKEALRLNQFDCLRRYQPFPIRAAGLDALQHRPFRLRPGLTLYRDVCLRRGAKVLSESHGLADHQKADCQHHCCCTFVLHLPVDLHRDSALVAPARP